MCITCGLDAKRRELFPIVSWCILTKTETYETEQHEAAAETRIPRAEQNGGRSSGAREATEEGPNENNGIGGYENRSLRHRNPNHTQNRPSVSRQWARCRLRGEKGSGWSFRGRGEQKRGKNERATERAEAATAGSGPVASAAEPSVCHSLHRTEPVIPADERDVASDF